MPISILALPCRKREDFVGAEKAYRQVLRLQPNLLAAKQALSATLIVLGESQGSREPLRARD